MARIKKFEIIFNQTAGNGQSKSTWKKVEQFLTDNQIQFHLNTTLKDGDGIRIAKTLADEIDAEQIILVIGGDGTLNQALNGIKLSDHPQTPLAYIPSGSGNDFSRGVKIKHQDPTILLEKSWRCPNQYQSI